MNCLNVSDASLRRRPGTAALPLLRAALAATVGILGIATGAPATANPSFAAGSLGLTSYTDPVTGNTTVNEQIDITSDPDTAVLGIAPYRDASGFGGTLGFAYAMAGDRYVKARAGSVLDSAYAPRGVGAFDYGGGFIDSPTGYVGGTLGIGRADWITVVAPTWSGDASVTSNLHRKLQFTDSLSLSDRIADMQQAVILNSLPPYDPVTTDPIQFMSSLLRFQLRVEEFETGNSWALSWTDYLERRLELRTGGVFLNQGAATWSDTSIYDAATDTYSGTSAYYPIYTLTTPPNSSPGALGFERDDPYDIPISFSSGYNYIVSLSLQCSTFIFITPGASTNLPVMSADCDASRSGYWTGLTNFRDSDGNAIAPFGLIEAGTGLDISGASPAYRPGGVTSVPEPASWTMLITGFSLAGASLRRRRTRAVTACA